MLKNILFVVVTMLFGQTFLACTSANEQALAKMNGGQRNFLDQRIDKIRAGMSEREVSEILGLPRSGEGSPRPCYDAPAEGDPQAAKGAICVRFVLYKATLIEWQQGRGEQGFVYTIDLVEKEKQRNKK